MVEGPLAERMGSAGAEADSSPEARYAEVQQDEAGWETMNRRGEAEDSTVEDYARVAQSPAAIHPEDEEKERYWPHLD